MKKKLTLLLTAFLIFPTVLSFAQAVPGEKIKSEISEDNWELWRKGFELYEAGEIAFIEKKYEDALKLYEDSLEMFQSVHKANPSWNKSVIEYRITLCNRKIRNANRKIEELASIKSESSKAADARTDAPSGMTAEDLEILKRDAERGKAVEKQVTELIREKDSADKKYNLLLVQYNELKKQFEGTVAETATDADLKAEKLRSETLAKNIAELQGKLNDAEKVISSYGDSQKALETELKNVESSRKILEKELESAQKTLTSATEKSAETAKLKEENEKLSADLDNTKKQLSERASFVESQKKELAKISADYVTLEGNLEQSKKEAKQLANDLKAALETNKAPAVAADGETAKLSAEVKRLQSDINAITAARNAVERELKEKSESAVALQKQNETLAAAVEKSEKEIKTLNEITNNLRQRLEQSPKESDNVVTTDKSTIEILNRLRSEIKSGNESIAKLEAELSEKTDAFTKLTSETKTKDEKISILENNLSTRANALTKSESEIKSLKTELAKIKENAGAYAKEELEKLTGEVTELREARTQLENTVKTLTESKTILTNSNQKLEDELGLTRKELERVREIAKDDRVTAAVQEQLNRMKENVISHEKLSEHAQSDLKVEKENNATLKNELDKLKKQLDESKERETKLSNDLKKWMSGSDEVILEKLATKDEVITELVKEMEEIKSELTKSKELVDEKNAQIMRSAKKITEIKDAANAAATDARSVRAILKQAQKIYPDFTEQIKNTGIIETPVTSDIELPVNDKPQGDQKGYDEAIKQAAESEAKGDNLNALWYFLKAADAGMEKPEPYLGLTRVHLRNGDQEKAKKAYETALKLGAQRDLTLEKEVNK